MTNSPSVLLDGFMSRFSSRNTRVSYRHDIEAYFGPVKNIPEGAFGHVTFTEVNQYIEQLENEGLRSSTITRRVATLSSFFGFLVATGAIETNPISRDTVRRIKKQGVQPRRSLTEDEVRRLIKQAKVGSDPERDVAMILVGINCAPRRSEMAAMRVEDLTTHHGWWILRYPVSKGGVDQWVKIPKHIVDAIRTYQRVYHISDGPLWRKHDGTVLNVDHVFGIIRRLGERAGLGRIGPHVLRHTACSLSLANGATIEQVRQLARHKSITTTMRYVHCHNLLENNGTDFIPKF